MPYEGNMDIEFFLPLEEEFLEVKGMKFSSYFEINNIIMVTLNHDYEELTKEDRHGEVQEETSDEEAKRKDREEAKKQNAKEISENKDANGNAVVGFANNIEENKDKLAIDLAKAAEKLEQNQEIMRYADSTLDKTLDSLRDESVGSYANHITAIQVKESVADDVKM